MTLKYIWRSFQPRLSFPLPFQLSLACFRVARSPSNSWASCNKLFEFTGKSSANNYKQYRKLIQEDSERSYNQYILLQLLLATSQDSGELTFQQDCRSAQNTLFYGINISQGSVATCLRWGGIFNDHFVANFLENVTVKEFWKSASIWRSYV